MIPPVQVGWYLGDTTQSLAFLAQGAIDVAVTYNEAAEEQSQHDGYALKIEYGFRVITHFDSIDWERCQLMHDTGSLPSCWPQAR
jgi:hypothetical protein